MSNTKKIKAKPTHTQELVKMVSEMMRKYNIPTIMVVADNETKQTGVVMDDRNAMHIFNKSVLMDAMVNTSGNLMNLIFDAVATIIALSPKNMHEDFEAYIQKIREEEKKRKNKIINNTAEA